MFRGIASPAKEGEFIVGVLMICGNVCITPDVESLLSRVKEKDVKTRAQTHRKPIAEKIERINLDIVIFLSTYGGSLKIHSYDYQRLLSVNYQKYHFIMPF